MACAPTLCTFLEPVTQLVSYSTICAELQSETGGISSLRVGGGGPSGASLATKMLDLLPVLTCPSLSCTS